MRSMPHVTFLDGGDSALALEVEQGYGLVFRPTHPPNPDGGWDWKKVDSIIVLGLIKY